MEKKSSQNPGISIITINLNNREGLEKTIRSVVDQTSRDFEWIIIDGGSNDESNLLIQQYSEYMDAWISESDSGIYNAMNKGIKLAHGDYLLFLNSGDVLYSPDVIEKVKCRLKGADLYIGSQMTKGGIDNPSIDSIDLIRTLIIRAIPHQATFIKKDLFNRLGLYNEEYKIISDWEFFIKAIILNNCSVEKLPYIISEKQPNGISVTDNETNLSERQEVLEKINRIIILSQYHTENNDILKAVKNNKFIFFIFRCYFFFYRKFHR